MDPTTSLLLKAAAAGAAPAARQIGKWTVRWRVAWAVSRAAKRRGLQVAAKTLRQWLARSDAQEQLSKGSADAIESALGNLAWRMPGSAEEQTANAETVLMLLYTELLKAQEPSTAVALASEWQRLQTTHEHQLTRAALSESSRSIHDRLAVSQSFDHGLSLIHPWWQEKARALRAPWPSIESLVSSLTATDNPGQLLTQWAEEPPNWYQDAPADALTWLGQLAMDYQQYPAANIFLSDALTRGAYPIAYWRSLRALSALQSGLTEAAEELLEQTAATSDLAAGILALQKGDYDEGIAALTRWRPRSEYDTALKGQLLARLTVGNGNIDRAVELAVDTARDSESQHAGLLASELLLTRSRFGHSLNRLHDTEVATSLAVQTRNKRRRWKGDSAGATLVAVKAAVLSGDLQQAWRFIRPQPEGEATHSEAQDPRLRRQAAELAAWHQDWTTAEELAGELADPFLSAEIAALRAESAGDRDQAVRHWHTAAAVADEPTDTLRVAMSLAELGAELPDLTELEVTHPEVVEEIRLVKRTLGASDDPLSALRAGAADSIILTLKLAEHLSAADEHLSAGEVLQSGAERWTQPRMMLMSAYAFREGNAPERAVSAAIASLNIGGRKWAGEFEARALLFELHTDAGEWEDAIKQARILVSLDSNSINARWALAHALARRADLEGAWAAIHVRGSVLQPRNRDEALLWGQLSVRFDQDPGLVSRILEVSERWPDDEQLVGILLGQLIAGAQQGDVVMHPDDILAFNAATKHYSEQFPNSGIFRMMKISQGDDPIADISRVVRDRHESLQELAARVEDGSVPLGVGAELSGGTYAESSIRTMAGFVRCHDPSPSALAAAALTKALGSSVVIDTTAVRTIALLPPDVRDKLRGAFSHLTVTDAAFLDALRAAESLGLRSTNVISWDPEGQRPVIRTVDANDAEDWASEAEAIVQVMSKMTRRSWANRKSLPSILPDWEWLGALDLAATEGLPFWSDDAVFRQVARSVGVVTFDSIELMRLLAARSQLDRHLADVSEAILLSHYYADLGFKAEVFDLAASIVSWRPAGAAFALTRPLAWENPNETLAFALRGAEMRASESLDDIRGWLASAAVGVSRIVDDPEEAARNLQILLGRCLALPWMTPERAAVAVEAVRVPLHERVEVVDPLQPVLRATYADLVAQHGYEYARSLLMSLTHYLPESDRYAATRIILTYEGPGE